jgi:hypothetical protein
MKELFNKTNGWTKEGPKEDGLYACRKSGGSHEKVIIVIIKNGNLYPRKESATVSYSTISIKSLGTYYNSCEWFKIEESKTFNIKLTWWDFLFGLFVFGYFLIATYGSYNTPT